MASILTLLHSERPKLHRKAKIICNFGLPECSRANYKGFNLRRAKLFALRVDSPVIDRQKCVCVCIPILVTTYRSGVQNHCRTYPAPCVRPHCVCSVLRAHAQFCRFDKADATADVQWHFNHQPPLWYHYFPAQSLLGADILVCWIGKIVRTFAPGGSRTLMFDSHRGHMSKQFFRIVF